MNNSLDFNNTYNENDNKSIQDISESYNIFDFNLSQTLSKDNESEIFERKMFFIELPTSAKTDNNKKIEKEKKNKKDIFSFKKIAKEDKAKIIFINKGRRKKKDKHNINKNKNYHSKSKEDNMLHKIKVFFIKSSMNLINKRYNEFQTNLGKTKKKFFCKIKSEYISTIKKESNLEFLKTNIKDLFSSNISKIYNKLDNNYNKKIIEEIYEENQAKKVIEILDKTVEELIKNYVNGDYKNEGFYIENELVQDRIKNPEDENNEEYEKKFIERAKNIKNIFTKKISRRKKRTNMTK